MKPTLSGIVQNILLWANVAAAALYLASAYIGYADPRTAGYAALLALAYPAVLLLTVAFLPLWLIVRKRFMLISAAALLLTMPQLWAFCPLNTGGLKAAPSDSVFTVMTYNIYGMKKPTTGTAHPTITEILKYDADFVCLQETAPLKKLQERMSESQKNLLLRRYPYTHASAATSLGYFSRQPVTLVRTLDDNKYFSLELYKTTVGATATFIVNTHLESIGLTESDKELYMDLTSVKEKNKTLKGVRSRLMNKLTNAYRNRAVQARQIQALTDSLRSEHPDANLIVCGDFNDTPYSYAYLTIRDGMQDAYSDGAFGPTYTYNENRFYFKIDHIFYQGRLKAVHTTRGNSRSSDHYPLIATFKITNLNM